MKRIITTLALALSLFSATGTYSDAQTKEEKKDLSTLRRRLPVPEAKASVKERETAPNILECYKTGIIKVDWEKITFQQMRELGRNVRIMATAAAFDGGEALDNFNDFMDYLYEIQFIEKLPKLKYSNYSDVRKVPADFLCAVPMCNKERRSRFLASMRVFLEADQIHESEEYIRTHVNTDYIYNAIPHVLTCCLYDPDENKCVEEVKAFSHFLSACSQHTPGAYDGLKVDGTGFHHWTHYNGYMYAYRTWVHFMKILSGTSFRVTEQAYENMKKAVVSYYLMSVNGKSDNYHIFGNSMAGRHPFTGMTVSISAEVFEELIEVGGDIKGTGTDAELAAYYNTFFKSGKYKSAGNADVDGFYQFNNSPAAIYRRDNWVAAMRCPTTNAWGAEIYDKANRFGRYQSHGTLEIIYEGGLATSGYPTDEAGTGWDWNMMPGSTTVHYTDWAALTPNGNDKDRFDQKSASTDFAGALSAGDCGIFAAEFDQDDNWGSRRFIPTRLEFRKSVFAIDGMLWAMGSDISAIGEYPQEWLTATNLFQQVCATPSLTINGDTTTESKTYQAGETINILTPTGTGFVIPADHDPLVTFMGSQESPSSKGLAEPAGSASVAKAYFNHGAKPASASYAYLAIPAADQAGLDAATSALASGRLFEICKADSTAHIVRHIPSSTIAYSLFGAADGLSYGCLKASNSELLVIEKPADGGKSLELSLCNPDMKPSYIDKRYWLPQPTDAEITISGIWHATSALPESCSLRTGSAGDTILSFHLTEGLPLHLTLERD